MGLWKMLIGEEPGILETIINYENKGQYGEYALEYAITHNNLSGYSKALHNVYIKNNNKTVEIDVVLMHEKGIFVFESKNYSGWIFGNEDSEKWVQSLPNGKKNQFYNPIKQNNAHCKAIAKFLQISESSITSYITFSNRCELKEVPEDKQTYKIVKRDNLLTKLRNDLKERKEIFQKNEIDDFEIKLLLKTNVSDIEKIEHVEQIKRRVEGNICPFCGAEIKIRSGKYGNFYGCTNYPKCKFTRKIN